MALQTQFYILLALYVLLAALVYYHTFIDDSPIGQLKLWNSEKSIQPNSAQGTLTSFQTRACALYLLWIVINIGFKSQTLNKVPKPKKGKLGFASRYVRKSRSKSIFAEYVSTTTLESLPPSSVWCYGNTTADRYGFYINPILHSSKLRSHRRLILN